MIIDQAIMEMVCVMLSCADRLLYIFGGASAASEATLSSCPLIFAIHVSIVRAINP